MNQEQIIAEITALKNLLEQSDHVPNKLVEGIVLALDGATAINAIILSFVMSRGDVFKTVIILFPVIVTVRSIVFAIDIARKKPIDYTDMEADAEITEE